MVRIRDAGELQRTLDKDFSWRVQEIQNIQQVIFKLKKPAKDTFLRASIPMFYAHYEGFIKGAAISYANFLSSSGLTFGQIRQCMRGVRAMQKIQQLGSITRRFSAATDVLNELASIADEKVTIPLHEHIEETGNLNFETLTQILELLYLNSGYYHSRKAFIEESLLFNRNGIAHGDRYPIDQATFDSLHSEVLNIMRCFKTDIENAITLKTYMGS